MYICQGCESALCVPSAELQIAGKEKEFQTGLAALKKLTEGPIHLVYRKDSPAKPSLRPQE